MTGRHTFAPCSETGIHKWVLVLVSLGKVVSECQWCGDTRTTFAPEPERRHPFPQGWTR